ncbi:MAG: methylated-DNA--[Clostridia bacterium]|nr:methylated-DNA--[protein]-cysteine S-methyltransferase [Clostridia bacterium]
MIYYCRYESPLGEIELSSDGDALTGLRFSKNPEPGQKDTPLPVFLRTARWLDIYFGGEAPDFMPKLSLCGTPFRREVWDAILSIPFGQTATYGEIARVIAKKRGLSNMSPRAVGSAAGHNPVMIIVPCHRVVGADGRLTGYAGGVGRKAALLRLEGNDMTKLK